MPYKFTPEFSEFSNIRKELEPLKELSLSAKRIADSAESHSLSAEKLAASSKDIAESSEVLSFLAIKKANKADIKGWISVIIAFFAFLLELCGRFGLF